MKIKRRSRDISPELLAAISAISYSGVYVCVRLCVCVRACVCVRVREREREREREGGRERERERERERQMNAGISLMEFQAVF
jgi:hypothetical protein